MEENKVLEDNALENSQEQNNDSNEELEKVQEESPESTDTNEQPEEKESEEPQEETEEEKESEVSQEETEEEKESEEPQEEKQPDEVQEEKVGFFKKIKNWFDVQHQKAEVWSKKKPMRRKLYLNRTLYLMMFPYLLLFFTFTILPVVMSFLLSFTDFNLLQFPPNWRGLQNYFDLFLEDSIFLIAIKNTLIIAVIVGPGGYMLSFVFAWLINELPRYLRAVITFVFYAPALTGAVSIWALIFSSDYYGWANSLLISLNIIREPITWLKDTKYILPIVILVQLWSSLGVNFLTLIAGLKGVSKEFYEAGAIDGIRNRWQELWYITLPCIKEQLLFSAVIQISNTLGVGAITTQLCGFPSVQYAGHTIVNHLTDYTSTRYELGYASAIATLLFLASIGLNSLIRKLIRKVGS